MFKFAAGFVTCAVLCVLYPQVGAYVHAQAARLIEWGGEVIAEIRGKKK